MHNHHVPLLHCTSTRSSTPGIVLSSRLAILTNNMPGYTHYAIVVTLSLVLILHAPISQAAPVDRSKFEEYAIHCNGHKNWNNGALSTTARASGGAPHCRGQDEPHLDDESSPTKLKDTLTVTTLEPRKAVMNQGFFDWSKAGKVFWAMFAFFSSAVAATFLFWGEIPRLPPGRKILYKPWFKQTRVFAPGHCTSWITRVTDAIRSQCCISERQGTSIEPFGSTVSCRKTRCSHRSSRYSRRLCRRRSEHETTWRCLACVRGLYRRKLEHKSANPPYLAYSTRSATGAQETRGRHCGATRTVGR